MILKYIIIMDNNIIQNKIRMKGQLFHLNQESYKIKTIFKENRNSLMMKVLAKLI